MSGSTGRGAPDDATLDVVAAALAAGATAREAGGLVERSDRTVRRWRVETDLDQRVLRRRREMLGEIGGGLARVAALVPQVLGDIVADDAHPDQLRAALAVLDRALRYHAAGETDRLITELEARIAQLEVGAGDE